MRARIHQWLAACGMAPLRSLRLTARLPRYLRDYRAFKRSFPASAGWGMAASYPCLADQTEAGGSASGHYFHQDLLVAQRIYARQPRRHIDVGSRIDGFVAHVATFRPIDYYDLRPVPGTIKNITFHAGDLLRPETFPSAACDSLSSLHVIEHVGLGRYGDRIEPEGWRIALQCLATMLEPEGTLFLSVPIGRQRVEFNAHRVFAPSTITNAACELGLTLVNFAWIDDAGALHDHPATGATIPAGVEQLNYGCGIFEFRRVPHAP
jgi:hypothetical protein